MQNFTFDEDQDVRRYFGEPDHRGPTGVPSRPVDGQLRDDQPRLRAYHGVRALERPHHVGLRVPFHVAVHGDRGADVRVHICDC